ncbi:putative DD41D transposase [Trichonephila clavipes]|nr:putative DD41D transposase [Trichonephila clavipes]
MKCKVEGRTFPFFKFLVSNWLRLKNKPKLQHGLSNLSLQYMNSIYGTPPHQSLEDNLVALHFKYDQARRRFVEWAQNEIADVPDFHKRILFSDEAHFWLNGYVNKQNCRIWSEANPQVYVETPLHPEKLTVWCALWAGGILLQKR